MNSFGQYFLSTHYVPGTDIGRRSTMMNKRRDHCWHDVVNQFFCQIFPPDLEGLLSPLWPQFHRLFKAGVFGSLHPQRCYVWHFIIFLSLLKLVSIESIMPSSHSLYRLLHLPSTFPSIRLFSSELALHIKWLKYWSFSFSISASNEYSGFISFRIWLV